MFKASKWLFLAVALLMLTACGKSDEASVTAAPEQVESTQQDTPTKPTSEPTQEPQQAPQTTLRCEDALPIELPLGDTIDAEIDGSIWTQCFWVEIPEGLTSATFELTGMSADLNLAVGYGFLVTVQYHMGEFWRPGEDGTADEVLVLDNPKPGPYFITVGIAGPKEPSEFTLGVHTEPDVTTPASDATLPDPEICAPPAKKVDIGSEISSEIVGKEGNLLPRDYFCVQVPEGLNSLTLQLLELEGDLELFVRFTTPADWMDRSRGGSERVVVIENPEPGAYYVEVAGAYPGAGSPFKLNVSSP